MSQTGVVGNQAGKAGLEGESGGRGKLYPLLPHMHPYLHHFLKSLLLRSLSLVIGISLLALCPPVQG